MMFFAVFCSVVFLLFAGFVVRAWRAGSGAPLKEAGWGVLAGVAAGVVWGVGARLAMRLVAVADGRPTEFSVGGTLVIVITGMMFGLPLGLLFATVRGHLPGSGIGRGISFGVILAVLLLVPVIALGASDLGRDPLDAPVLLGAALFSALFSLHGAVMEAMIGRGGQVVIRRRTSRPPPVPTAAAARTPHR